MSKTEQLSPICRRASYIKRILSLSELEYWIVLPVSGAQIKIPLKDVMNRHGLHCRKQRERVRPKPTLQVIALELSLKGVPSVLMDLKGEPFWIWPNRHND